MANAHTLSRRAARQHKLEAKDRLIAELTRQRDAALAELQRVRTLVDHLEDRLTSTRCA